MVNGLPSFVFASLALMQLSYATSTPIDNLDWNSVNSDSKTSILKKDYSFSSNEMAEVNVEYKNDSEEITKLKAILKGKTKKEIQNYLLNELGPEEKKVVKEFSINWEEGNKLSLRGRYRTKFANKKTLIIPDLTDYEKLIALNRNNEGGFDASKIPNIDHTYSYKNIYAVGGEPKFCNIQSSWINAVRSIEYLPNGIQIKDSVQLLKKSFSKDDIIAGNFSVIAEQLNECFFKGVMQITFESKKHLVVTSEFENSIKELPLKERLERRITKVKEIFASCDKSNGMHIEMARILLERNLKEDPTFLPTYQHMSYYHQTISSSNRKGVNNESLLQALKYIDLALGHDPTFTEALISKAFILCRLDKCDESKKILEKQVLTKDAKKFSYLALRGLTNFYYIAGDNSKQKEFSDLSMLAAETNFEKSEFYSGIGGDAYQAGNLKVCVEQYKKAIEADNESSCNHYHLGECYLEQNDFDKSIISFSNALTKREFMQGRLGLSRAYALKGVAYQEAKEPKKSQEMFDKSLNNVEDWRTNLALLKFYAEIDQMEEAYKVALKAAELFDGDPKVLSGYIIQDFKKKDKKYSKFMKRIIDNMTDRYNANELGYYVAYELQANKVESQIWIKQSLEDLKNIPIDPEDKDNKMAISLLSARFYLLSLSETGSLLDLEKANEFLANAIKVSPKGPQMHSTKFYVEEANRAFGKGRFLWDYRLKVEKEKGLKLPMWMVFWMSSTL